MYAPLLSEMVLPAKLPLALGLKEAILIVTVPLAEVGAAQLGVHTLTPVTLDVIIPVVIFNDPPTMVKSRLFARAAVGSAKANNANKITRLMECSSEILDHLFVGGITGFLRFSHSPSLYFRRIRLLLSISVTKVDDL